MDPTTEDSSRYIRHHSPHLQQVYSQPNDYPQHSSTGYIITQGISGENEEYQNSSHLKSSGVFNQQPIPHQFIPQPAHSPSNGHGQFTNWPIDIPLPPEAYQDHPSNNIYNLQQYMEYQNQQHYSEVPQVPTTSVPVQVQPRTSEPATRRPITYQYQQVRSQSYAAPPVAPPPPQRINHSVIRHTVETQGQLGQMEEEWSDGPFQIMKPTPSKPIMKSSFIVVNGHTHFPGGSPPPVQLPQGSPEIVTGLLPQVDFQQEFNAIMEQMGSSLDSETEFSQLSLDSSFSLQPPPSHASPPIPVIQQVMQSAPYPLPAQRPGSSTPLIPVPGYSESHELIQEDVVGTSVFAGKPRRGRGKANLNPGRDPTTVKSPVKKSTGRGAKKHVVPVTIIPSREPVLKAAISSPPPENVGLVNQFHSMSFQEQAELSPDITSFKSESPRGRGRGSRGGRGRRPTSSETKSPRPRKTPEKKAAAQKPAVITESMLSLAMNAMNAGPSAESVVPGTSPDEIFEAAVASGIQKQIEGDQQTLRDIKTEATDDATLAVPMKFESDASSQQLTTPSSDAAAANPGIVVDPNVAKVISQACLQPKGKRVYRRKSKPNDLLHESPLMKIKIEGGTKREREPDAYTEKRVEVKVVPIKFTRPTYSQEERDFLYADKKWVINMDDAEKPPDQIFIWRIIRSKQCLLQYYPCKHGGEQYYQTGAITWHFTTEDFLSEEFYEKFQPIIVIVANTRELGPPAPNWPNTNTDLTTVQYVFHDRLFFNRMIKYIYKIQQTDTQQIRQAFMSALKALTLLIFHPDLLTATFGNPEYEIGKQSWVCLRAMTNTLVDGVSVNYAKKAFAQTKKYPALCYNHKLSESDKKIPCMACGNRNRPRVPCVKVSFDGTVVGKVPYNPDTFLDLAGPASRKFPQDILWCKPCSRNLKKIHKLAHFWYSLGRLIKQNVCKDIENFHEMNAPISDDVIVWIQSNYISWKNVMFADFQLTYAEVEDLIVPVKPDMVERPTTPPQDAAAPPPNPTPPPPEPVQSF